MTSTRESSTAMVNTLSLAHGVTARQVELPDYDRERIEDVGFLNAMTLVLLGNYAQTGHFGGPLAYTPYTVSSHLIGPDLGGLRYDYRRPKHPYSDRFMLAGGHNAPVTYALWMIMGEALARKHARTGDDRYSADPNTSMLSIDALGFRRGRGALDTLLKDNDLVDHPLMAQAKIRGIRSLAGHSETTDLTNDVNGGPSGIGIATSAGKAAFWDIVGAPDSLKVIAIEGEFAMTSGHSQEMKTAAVAQQVGKRLRILLSYNNAGIDDELVGSVIRPVYDAYRIEDQWAAYGWNVMTLDNGNDYDQVVAALKTMEEWDHEDDRPMIVVGKTVKGWWPGAVDGQIPGYGEQVVSYHSHPYNLAMNADYFVALAGTFERRFGVEFEGIRDGAVSDNRERLIQFKRNMDIAMSVLDKNGLGDWIADRLVEIGESVDDSLPLRIDRTTNPFKDSRLKVKNLPVESQSLKVVNPVSGEDKDLSVKLFEEPGNVRGTRRAISEIIKWANYVTNNRFIVVAADLAESINVEHGAIWDTFDPVANPTGGRLKAAIQEAGNASTAIGLVGQSASLDPDEHVGVWALSGTYGAFTPLMYLPSRVWSQQNQDSPFRTGVLHILAGHSGPETAADARTHFGIFSPQVWKLFPRGQTITLSFWDYNDVAPRLLRGRRDRRARQESRCDRPRSGQTRLPSRRPQHLRRQRPHGSGQGVLRHPRLQSRQAQARLRRRAGVVFHGQPRLRPASTRRGRCERQGHIRHQRRVVHEAVGGVPELRSAVRGEVRLDGSDNRHSPDVAPPERRPADRRVLSDIRLGQPVANWRLRIRRDRRGPPRRRVHLRGHQALRRRPRVSAIPTEGSARRSGTMKCSW